jgi:hypothetical protein
MKLSMQLPALSSTLAGLAMATTIAASGFAQQPSAASPAAPGQQAPQLFQVVPPPQPFKTSTEHYQYLKRLHKGGTQHSWESVPKWEGIWQPSWNSVAFRGGVSPFFAGPIPVGLTAGGEVARGVLSPAYEAAFVQRREGMKKFNQQPYDRLTTCEPAGMPRWLLEPYVREFVNTPGQSWWMNDLANDTRRIYIGQEHKNIDNTHFPQGDSVGFWAGDHLIVHTINVWPNDYFRGYPPTSNQFESVEVWHRETRPNGDDVIIVQTTFYDPIGLAKPLNGVYTFTRATTVEEAGFRMRWWECSTNQNTSLTAEGTTQLALPGEKGFNDVRGTDQARRNPDLPKDLPGQSRDPNDSGEASSLDAALRK